MGRHDNNFDLCYLVSVICVLQLAEKGALFPVGWKNVPTRKEAASIACYDLSGLIESTPKTS